jgi:hypothetical protein
MGKGKFRNWYENLMYLQRCNILHEDCLQNRSLPREINISVYWRLGQILPLLQSQLWNNMADIWKLPALQSIQILELIDCCTSLVTWQKVHNVGCWWLYGVNGISAMRCMRNNPPPLEVSRRFLTSYMDYILQIMYHHAKDIVKGKFILDKKEAKFHSYVETVLVLNQQTWTPPPSAKY